MLHGRIKATLDLLAEKAGLSAVGVNKLNRSMKTMVQKAGIQNDTLLDI